jgi:predicted outer membrane repeat protein
VKRGSGTVSFDCGAKPATIVLDRPLAFWGEGSSRYVLDGRGLVTLDGRDRTGLVTLDGRPGVSYTFRGLTFTRGRTTARGAAIHGGWRNRLLVENCTFTSNAVTPSSDGEAGGGAIYAHEGSATVRRSTFRGNTARLGGALMSTITDVVVESSTFIGNRAAYAGGAIYADAGVLIVRGSTVSGNRATYQAGGIWMWHPDPRTARIERSTISDNRMVGSGTTGGMGAGILNSAGPLLITDSTISGNVTYSLGGGIFSDSGAVTARRTRFVGNKAKAGGALFRAGGSITTTACTFSRNSPKDVR